MHFLKVKTADLIEKSYYLNRPAFFDAWLFLNFSEKLLTNIYYVIHTIMYNITNQIGGEKVKFESQLLKGVAGAVVLEILCRGQMYGYELSEAIEQRSGEILSLGKGTLYPLLYNLEAKKLVRSKWQKSESGRMRKYYSITAKGKKKLDTQKQELIDISRGMDLIFGGAIRNALA